MPDYRTYVIIYLQL